MVPLIFSVIIASTTLAVSPPAQCVTLNTNLRYQMTDAATHGSVTTLQNFLVASGYLNVKATGYFGLYTLRAAQAFQKNNGLYAAGFVGPQTRLKITALTCLGAPVQSFSPTGIPVSTSTVVLKPAIGSGTGSGNSGTGSGNSGGSGSSGVSISSGGGSGTASPAALPDSAATYIRIKTEYDAAPTLDAFVAVSERYASAARRDDVIAQKAYLSDLSAAEKNEILNSSIRSTVPRLTEFNTVTVNQNGTMATILITPLPTSGKDASGAIIMVLENGQWKLQAEKWQNAAGFGIEPLPSAGGG